MALADRAPAPRRKARQRLAGWGEARPLPGLAASAARPIRGWLLLSLIAVYSLTGLFSHGPWRGDDILGVALTRVALDGVLGWDSLSLLPHLAGDIHAREGPLGAWLAALLLLPIEVAAQLMGGVRLAPERFDDLVRLIHALWLTLGLYALWRATIRLAHRREARPVDPLGIGPDAHAYGRTLGDCAVLLALACLGTVTRWHEAGPAALSFLLQAGLIWALACAPERPRPSGRFIGALLAALLLTDGIETALACGLGLVVVTRVVHVIGLVRGPLWREIGWTFSLGIGLWIAATLWIDGAARTGIWWSAQFQFHLQAPWRAINDWAWTWWPLWPIVAVLIVQAKRHGLLQLAHIQMLLILLGVIVLVGWTGIGSSVPGQLIPVAPLAILGAFGLLSIPRSLTNLLDWFAVVVFTTIGALIWLYWSAMVFEFPQELAQRLRYFAPGLQSPQPGPIEVLFGTAVSGLWLSLVVWRVRRTGLHLWRPVALSAGGLGLAWILMMALWLPALDVNRGFHPLSDQLNRALEQALPGHSAPTLARWPGAPNACVSVPAGDTPARLLLLATTSARLGRPGEPCPLRFQTSPAADQRLEIWSGTRPTDRQGRERYVLLVSEIPRKDDR